jgi:hypothetical protein
VKGNPDWERQKSFSLKDPPPGKCRPDLLNSSTGMIVELKMCPNEPFTENQKRFQEELARGKHKPLSQKSFVKVTRETCGC